MTMDEIKKIVESTPQTVESVASSVVNRAKRGLPLDLQFFAQDDVPPEDDEDKDKDQDPDKDDNKDPDKKKKKNDEPKFTQKQLDEIVQERVKRLEKDKQEALDEAAKLAKMSADQKKEYEFKKLQRENEELKAAQNRWELGKTASAILAESGITADDEILDFVVKEDAEKTNEAVKAFTDLVDRIADEKMKEKLAGKAPKRQNGTKPTMTKDEIMQVQDTVKRHKLIEENIHLFR